MVSKVAVFRPSIYVAKKSEACLLGGRRGEVVLILLAPQPIPKETLNEPYLTTAITSAHHMLRESLHKNATRGESEINTYPNRNIETSLG